MSGLGTYLRELLGAFARIGAPVRWTLIGPEALRERMPPGLEIERWITWERPVYGVWGSLRYPAPGAVDVFHFPHYNMPPFVRARHRVVTVFDLFHKRYGSWPKRRYQGLYLRWLRLTRAHVLTASAKTAQELTRLGAIPARRISIVPLGPGRRPTAPSGALPPEVLSVAGTPLHPPWLLATGIDQPHKNFDFMLSALGLYYQRRPEAPPLVWTGLRPEECQRRARNLPAFLRQRVALEPYSSPERVDLLYRGAAALIFPSLDEGFGLPPLEAMVRGVPVICSRCEPMTTILDKAPLYFDANESASFWRMLDRVQDSPQIMQDVIARGYRQAASYSWMQTARRTLALYMKLTGRETDAETTPAPTGESGGET
jgi:glycosyltransferase involved in cell wall biosynthesis